MRRRCVLESLLQSGGEATREEICQDLRWNPTSGHPKNVIGATSAPTRLHLVHLC